MIAEAKEFTTIGQIGLADARDARARDISRKMAELYVASSMSLLEAAAAATPKI